MKISKRVLNLMSRYADKIDFDNCSAEPGTYFSDNDIPKKEHWLYLARGWRNVVVDPICPIHLIHEIDYNEIRDQIKGAKPCDCDECKNN